MHMAYLDNISNQGVFEVLIQGDVVIIQDVLR